MAYRFTNTEKWTDSWFSNLKQIEMLLFIYLCDNCDIAGFIEVNLKRWHNDLNSSKETIEAALKGLERGLVFSNDNECIFIKNFLKHQKNLPLNENNKAHVGIMRRFELYSKLFDIQDINNFIEAPSKPLARGTGNGNGNGIDNTMEKNWKNDFEIYKTECLAAFRILYTNPEFISEQAHLNPGVNIKLTLEKAVKNFWSTEAGWKNKKSAKIKTIDWKATAINAISSPMNKVYLTKQEQEPKPMEVLHIEDPIFNKNKPY